MLNKLKIWGFILLCFSIFCLTCNNKPKEKSRRYAKPLHSTYGEVIVSKPKVARQMADSTTQKQNETQDLYNKTLQGK